MRMIVSDVEVIEPDQHVVWVKALIFCATREEADGVRRRYLALAEALQRDGVQVTEAT